MDYVRIPCSLIYNKQLGDKRVLFYSSLLFHCWDKKECDLTELSQYCGFCVDRHADANTAIFSKLLQDFVDAGYIEIKSGYRKIFTFLSKSPKNSFGIIYKYEFTQILEYRKSQRQNGLRVNHAHLLLLLSYIRLNMERQLGKPVVHFSMIKTISENIGLSTRSVSLAMKILEELSIIHHEPLPRYQDENGNWHTNVKIFVNMNNVNNANEYDWQQETYIAKQNLLVAQRQFIGGQNEI